jgi:5'-nucleotidase
MRRFTTAVAALAALLLLVAGPAAAQAPPPHSNAKEKLLEVQLLAFNDFHGHLEPNTPGTIAVGCCTSSGAALTVPAGGAEYFATHMAQLEARNPNTFVVSAGDLINASPLLSGLFHDEPTIEFMNHIGLDYNGVGNHEFDEGKEELLRMQNGGCHPVDGCQDGTPFYGSVFQFLAANVIDTSTNNPLLPPYKIENVRGTKIAFIGETLKGTPLIVTPTGVAGLDFLDEADTVNRLVPRLKQMQVETIVLLLHQGGTQAAPFAGGFMNVNGCENFRGPEILDIVSRLDPAVDVVVSGHTHQPYICRIGGRLVTGAASFGRLITQIDLTIDRRTGDVVASDAVNKIVTQDVAKDAATTELLAHYKTFADPIANTVVGTISGDLPSARDTPSGQNAAGEQPMGAVIADAQLAATSASDFGSSVIAFMNPGGVRAGLFVNQISSGGEQPGEVTYGELFAVQPFGNSLTVKTCTGAQIKSLLEQQFNNPSAGSNRILLISEGFKYTWSASAPQGSKVSGLELNGTPIDPAASYRVTMNSFLADGGDGFSVFTQCTDQLGGELDLDALVRYFQQNSPIAPPPLNRITRIPSGRSIRLAARGPQPRASRVLEPSMGLSRRRGYTGALRWRTTRSTWPIRGSRKASGPRVPTAS